MALKPDEFWSLTPVEFRDLIEGYKWRRDLYLADMAQLAYWIGITGRAKKIPTPQKLLGKEPLKQTNRIDPETKRKTLTELEAELGS